MRRVDVAGHPEGPVWPHTTSTNQQGPDALDHVVMPITTVGPYCRVQGGGILLWARNPCSCL